ncbi:MAG TPA: hypothetical protein VML50_14715, partial [Anaeromyxobacter sp.]|nr:hypothetical protein [Anaeromyxobacter sp.]
MTSPEPARPGLRPSPPPQAPAPGSLGVATAILALLALVLYHRQLLLGSTFLLRDQLIYTWTERKLLADALRAGRLPEWNDLVGFGTQFAASSANGLTYPPLWLVAVLPLPFAMDLVTALHVLLAGAGAAAFARRLGAGLPGMILAGAGLMACGYVASIAPNKVFAGTAWLPWIAWAADRVARAEGGLRSHLRAGWPLAAVLGAQLLAGDPAASVTGGLLAGVVILARSSRRGLALASLAAASGGAVVLGAASVLPGLALLPHTSRASLSLAEGAAWSLHPLRLLELVWPRLLGSPVDPRLDLAELLARTGPSALEPSWSHSLFVGGPILGLFALAVLRRRPGSGALAAGALALTVLALGTFTPAYAVFRATLPLEAITRYPEKHLAGALVLVLALAGAGLSSLERERWRLAAGALGAGTALLALPLALAGALRPRLLASLERAAGL